MDNFQLERYIMASLKKNIINSNESNYDRYHHNTDYNCALSILNHGILSIKTQNDLNISNISNNRLKLLDDTTSHINGIEGI